MLSFKERALRIASFLKKESLQDFLDTLSVAFIGSLLATFLFYFLAFAFIILKAFPESRMLFLFDTSGLVLLIFFQLFAASLACFIFNLKKKPSSFNLKRELFYLLTQIALATLLFGFFLITFLIASLDIKFGYFIAFIFLFIFILFYTAYRGIKCYVKIFVRKKAAVFLLSLSFLLLLLILFPGCLLEMLTRIILTTHILEQRLTQIIPEGEAMLAIPFIFLSLSFFLSFSFALGELFFKYLKNKNIFKSILNNWKA